MFYIPRSLFEEHAKRPRPACLLMGPKSFPRTAAAATVASGLCCSRQVLAAASAPASRLAAHNRGTTTTAITTTTSAIVGVNRYARVGFPTRLPSKGSLHHPNNIHCDAEHAPGIPVMPSRQVNTSTSVHPLISIGTCSSTDIPLTSSSLFPISSSFFPHSMSSSLDFLSSYSEHYKSCKSPAVAVIPKYPFQYQTHTASLAVTPNLTATTSSPSSINKNASSKSYNCTDSTSPCVAFVHFGDKVNSSARILMASTASSSATHSETPTLTPRSASPASATSHSAPASLTSKRRMTAYNPLASIDLSAIADIMKSSSLDQLRGYTRDVFNEVVQSHPVEEISQSQAPGYYIVREPVWNKGLSFTPEERASMNLTGLIPHTMESLQTQCLRAMHMIRTRQTPIDKYLYLSNLKAENVDLFYRLLMDNIRELMPLVYTPTIGDVCEQYSAIYTRPEALYISIKQRKSIRTMLRNWQFQDPEICVVTDGSRILGLGDLGVNGVGISIGKLALYTAAAGINPQKTLPIVLDSGTNNEAFLKDPLYLGLRQKRPSKAIQQDFMDDFMEAVKEVYPNMVVQFEDFESEKAFNYLDRYRNTHRCFNDDIQGTGAVVLAGYIGAVNLSRVPLEDQRLVFMGAGSAGVGVAKQLLAYYTRRGLTEEEARNKFWLVDTKGLVTQDRGDKLAEHKKYFVRTDNAGKQFRTLEEVIEYVKPSALVGLAATFGVFTESCVRALKRHVEEGGSGRRPILFPLSNPTNKAECTFEQAVEWTDGNVLFASGSPFSPVTMKFESDSEPITYHPNQGNNVYVFPGLGLGAILANASRITDEMVYTSAAALAESLNADEMTNGLIYPRVDRVREASVVVAREVMKAARREGVSQLPDSQWSEWEEWGDVALTAYIQKRIYDPTSMIDQSTNSRL